MCGICGIVYSDKSRQVDSAELTRMCDMLAHRGPDDAGIYIRGSAGLGHRRLSIIDVEGGHQPISNEDGMVWVVFNGEIYNYKPLREDLIKSGHQFTTNCDTEILVHLYEDFGTEFLHKLQGMFSFAIWDSRKERLFAARDRLGIKPFYYFLSGGKFIFASEIKAILRCGAALREVDEDYLLEYIVFRFVSGPNTLFKGVKSLLPGHALVWERGGITFHNYWSLQAAFSETCGLRQSQAMEKLDQLLENSVRRRLMSDVPLGTLNSGGVDSSLMTAYAAEMKYDPINTYSVGFNEPDYDESVHAALVSEKFKTHHHLLVVNHEQFARALPLSLWYNDEPLNHANSVLVSLICRLAKEKVTVLLTGEGADEVFGGYPRHWLLRFQQSFPKIVRRAAVFPLLFLNGHYSSKLKNFLPMSDHESLLLNSSFVLPESVRDLFEKNGNDTGFPFRTSIIQSTSQEKSLVDQGLYLDLNTYLVSILNRMDKMSMAAGVEARVPFLDHELVEFAITLPYRWKLNFMNFQTKSILKKLAMKRLPGEIIFRKKSGFGVPIPQWLKAKNGLMPFLNLLEEKKFLERGIFRKEKIKSIVDDHRKGKQDYSDLLWQLINVELWFRLFIDKLSSEKEARELASDIVDTKSI